MAELTLRQAKFVEALTTPNTPQFCNPTAAYKTVSPTITYGAQRNGASRLMTNGDVQQVLKGQLGVEQLGKGLRLNLRESKKLVKVKDTTVKLPALREHRDTLMDYARLTGQLVERREVTSLTPERMQALRLLLVEVLTFPSSVTATRPADVSSATTPATSGGSESIHGV